MAEAYIGLLKSFGFKEMQIWIATISALLFSGNLLGGILSALMHVNAKSVAQRPLMDRISFRLFLLSEVMLVVFVFFYHVFMIEDMTVSHIVYWFSAMLMMPLLAVIGSQGMLVAFSGKMKAKEQAHKRQMRAKRAQEMDKSGGGTAKGGPSKPAGGNPAERAMAKRQGPSTRPPTRKR